MRKEADSRKLYVGLDETNHGRYPEIIVAVSSFFESDANALKIYGRTRMNEGEVMRYLSDEQRDFRFLKAERGEIPRARNQLVVAAPYLVEQLLRSLNKRGERIDSVELLLDGDIRTKEINALHNALFELRVKRRVRTICVDYYPKSSKKEYRYPKILVAADSVAHFLRKGLEKLCSEQKLVCLPHHQ